MLRPAGIVSFESAAAETARTTVALNPIAGVTIQVTEIGISCNAAPNSTAAPVRWAIKRTGTALPTATSQTPEKLQSDLGGTLQTAGLVNVTVEGTLVGNRLHRWMVPNVSGMIWVAAPGREFDQTDGGSNVAAINLEHQDALPASVQAETYLVFEE
ncbi:MAG TPA: hypothetical protein VGQ24_10620 [Gemmatimonadales bacterium]|nr:hypothetical protein [Gemmatimonadales bacterium]